MLNTCMHVYVYVGMYVCMEVGRQARVYVCIPEAPCTANMIYGGLKVLSICLGPSVSDLDPLGM